MKNVMRVFSVVLLVMVGTVFAVGPAGLIVTLFKNNGTDPQSALERAEDGTQSRDVQKLDQKQLPLGQDHAKSAGTFLA